MLSYIITTHDRPDDLARTLARLGRIDHRAAMDIFSGVEVLVVDNASRHVPILPPALVGGLGGSGGTEARIPIRGLFRAHNEGVSARNVGAHSALGPGANADHWLVMLDDDTAPIDDGHFEAMSSAPDDVAAIGAEVFCDGGGQLDAGPRQRGGLPEVFIGSCAAIRRGAFIDAGGYDASMGPFTADADLAARLILGGWRVGWDRRLRARCARAPERAACAATIRQMVRTSVCLVQRYAPEAICAAEIDAIIERCYERAVEHHATSGFDDGLMDLQAIITSQPRRELDADQWDRLSGRSAVRAWLGRLARRGLRRVAMQEPEHAEGALIVQQTAQEVGLRIAPEGRGAEAVLVGTLCPGTMLDASSALRQEQPLPVLTAWNPGVGTRDHSGLLEAA